MHDGERGELELHAGGRGRTDAALANDVDLPEPVRIRMLLFLIGLVGWSALRRGVA